MIVSERDVEAYLRRRVESLGGLCLKFPAVYEEGIPDRLLVLPGGKTIFVEMKRPRGGKLSSMQKYQHSRLRRRGAVVFVLKNKGEVDRMLKEVMPNEVHAAQIPDRSDPEN